MFNKALSAATVALAASNMVAAQTFTKCNPLEKDCPADPAFGNKKVDCDFTEGKCDAFDLADGTTLDYNDKGAVFSIEKKTNAPTVETPQYIFFGRIDVEMQAAQGNGIVSSVVLQSDDLDEVDWEWVGGDNGNVQTNYFSKGNTETYDRGETHSVSSPLTSTHTYSIEWTKDALNWMIDGKTVRTLKHSEAGDSGPSGYPQTPMQVKLGTWVAGLPGTSKWTVEWAGGLTDFSKAPFNAYYKSIKIVDYAGGDGPASKSVKEYSYGDKSGKASSIVVKNGDGSNGGGKGGNKDDGDKDDDNKTKTTQAKPTTKPAPTSTEAAETSSEEMTTSEPVTTMETSMSTSPVETSADETSADETSAEETSPVSTDPAETTTPTSAASRGVAAIGAVLLAGAGAVAQFVL